MCSLSRDIEAPSTHKEQITPQRHLLVPKNPYIPLLAGGVPKQDDQQHSSHRFNAAPHCRSPPTGQADEARPGVHTFPLHLPREVLPSESEARMRHCLHESCTKIASFNTEGSKKAAYCKQHAEDDMVDVLSKRCSHHSCTRAPKFNVEGSKVRAYCKQHAEDGMVDVGNKRCSHHSCTMRPSFNTEGSKMGAYCKQHAKDGMVDVRHKRCSHHSCTKRPSWGVITDAVATVCSSHKSDLLDGAVINFKMACKVGGCGKASRWGLGGEQPTHCLDHGPLEEGLVRTLGTDRSKGSSRSSSSRGVRKCLNGEDGGTASKRARRAMPRTVAPVAAEEKPSPLLEPAKSRQIIWL